MRTIGLYLNSSREHARDCAVEVARLAREAGAVVAIADPDPDLADLDIGTPGARIENAELIVTVGGDGTLLRAVRVAVPLDIPIIGVNTGRLGFLTEVETTDDGLAALVRVLQGNYAVEERLALQVAINGVGSHFALNDVVVRRGAQARMAPFGLRLDGETIAHIPSDGIIVSTPTGSTGYFLSAGGPIISPTVDAFGIAALLPHTLFARPLIVPTTSIVEVSCDAEIGNANLETDGTTVADLTSGDLIRVVRAERPVKFARTSTRAFFERLEDKLQWGVPIKRP